MRRVGEVFIHLPGGVIYQVKTTRTPTHSHEKEGLLRNAGACVTLAKPVKAGDKGLRRDARVRTVAVAHRDREKTQRTCA